MPTFITEGDAIMYSAKSTVYGMKSFIIHKKQTDKQTKIHLSTKKLKLFLQIWVRSNLKSEILIRDTHWTNWSKAFHMIRYACLAVVKNINDKTLQKFNTSYKM